MESLTSSRLATLGHPQRLAIFRLLMRRYPDRLPAGEIASLLDLRPSTLSAYLAALMQAGLVNQKRSGTSLRYSVALETVRETFDYLLLDCCRGRPDICAPLAARTGAPAAGFDGIPNVLFLCTGNSARSIFAEAILHDLAGERFRVFSAGTHPNGALNPVTIEILRDKGHEVAHLRSKSIAEFQGEDAARMDFVLTVCDRAANEDCPPWPGQPVSAHWGIPDPVKAATPDRLAFEKSYDAVARRVQAFADLPMPSLDPRTLQHAVDEIGRMTQETTP